MTGSFNHGFWLRVRFLSQHKEATITFLWYKENSIFKWQLFSTFCLKETLLNDREFEEKYLIHVKLSFKNGLFSTSKLYEIVWQRKVELDKRRLIKLDNNLYSHLSFSTEKRNWFRNSVFWKLIHLSLQYLFTPPHRNLLEKLKFRN